MQASARSLSAGDTDALSLQRKLHGVCCVTNQVCHGCAGIYQEPNCRWKEDELDHAVTLMGYGRSTHGQEFWLIK